MFRSDAYDFPKVQYLPEYIDEIMDFDMEKAYLLDHTESGGFRRQVRYHQMETGDALGLQIEYFYKLERYDYSVQQAGEGEPNTWTEYVLTIGRLEKSKRHNASTREDFGRVIMIKEITPEELLCLRETACAFCEEALRLCRVERNN